MPEVSERGNNGTSNDDLLVSSGVGSHLSMPGCDGRRPVLLGGLRSRMVTNAFRLEVEEGSKTFCPNLN